MQMFGLVSLLIVIALAAWWLVGMGPVSAPPSGSEAADTLQAPLDPAIAAHIESKRDLIRVTAPEPQETISQPLTITGEARGYWFFEGDFPVILTDWDGRIIAEHYATANGDWMTEEFVPFSATVEYENPYEAGSPDFMRQGTLILKRDNPSGLPENDDALEFPVRFPEPQSRSAGVARPSYGEALDGARGAADAIGD